MRAPTVAGTLLAAALVTGCATTTIDQHKAENLLKGVAPAGGATVASAHCPSGVPASAGKSFDCQVKLTDGTTGTWTLHVENSQGLVTASRSDFTPNTSTATRGRSEVGRTKLLRASGGVRVKVTLVAFTPQVNEPSPDSMAHIAGVQVRITNVGSSVYRDGSPSEVSLLLLTNTVGADVAKGEQGPCGGPFYQTPLRVPPGKTVEGCIPFEVPSGATVASYKLTPEGEAGGSWSLG